MAKTGSMLRIEAATGRDIRDIILDAIQRGGTVAAAAAELQMTPGGLYDWIDRLDGTVETRVKVEFPGFVPSPFPTPAEEPVPA